jgi:hypothetical protein
MDKMRGYSVEKRRVDRFEPEIKRVLGEHLIQTADFERDTTQATDLLILSVHPVTIGCRVRRHNYVYSFSNELTIRAEIPKGRPTELQKVLDGWCDYGFYAFADQTDVKLLQWTLYRFDVFRETLRAMPNSGSDFVEKKLSYNEDGSSGFATFKWDEFPAEMIIDQRLVDFEPCDNKRCYNGKEWYRVPNAPNKWRTCLRCLGFEKVLKTDTDSDDSA